MGAKVVLVKNSDARDPAALLAKIKEERATCLLSVVPTVLNAVLDAVVPEEVPYDSIRLVLASGESLHLATCRRARAVFGPGALLVNQYGPSECTMTCTYHAVHELESHRDVALIGRPIQNTQIFVLGSDLRPAPVGASGEIHIGGQGLTLGYMNQPESTAENFVPNPFSEEPGARLYKTGDLARYLADGNLEFLGRIDHQVKIGGVRIEPGEIECVLRRHESLTDCAVVVRTLSNRGRNLIAKQSAEFTVHAAELQRLVAYIVCRNPSSTVDWRRYLEAELPPYMVPARFIELDALPMNANGKLDRRALPDPEQVRPKLEHPYASPRSSSESLVARLWQDTLDLDRVGVHDGFFELGGDSLMAMQVLNRLRHATGVDLGFQQLLEAESVESLARLIERPRQSSPEATRSIKTSQRDGRYPLSQAQQGLWFLWKMDPQSHYYTSQGMIHLRGSLDVACFWRSWQALVERHEALRARFGVEDGKPVELFSACEHHELQSIDLSGFSGADTERELRRAQRELLDPPFDLGKGSLLRTRFFRLSESEHALLLTQHEITVDLWSIRVMLRDLAALYQGFLSGEESPLDPLDVQYREYGHAPRASRSTPRTARLGARREHTGSIRPR